MLLAVVDASSALVLANFNIGRCNSSSLLFASPAICSIYTNLGTMQALLMYIIWLIVSFLNLREVAVEEIIVLALVRACFFLRLMLSQTPRKHVIVEGFSSWTVEPLTSICLSLVFVDPLITRSIDFLPFTWILLIL